MKIVKMERQKRNNKRFNLYSEEGYFMSASEYVVAKHRIEEGKTYKETELKAWAEEDDVEKAKGYTVDYLLGKTEHQIATKLKDKGYEPPVIERVLSFLHKYGYINDKQVGNALASDSLRLKKEGRNKIKQKMFQKGIQKTDIDEVMASIDEESEKEAAKFHLEKIRNKYLPKSKNKYEWKSKCSQFLMRKGFPFSVISSILEEEDWEM